MSLFDLDVSDSASDTASSSSDEGTLPTRPPPPPPARAASSPASAAAAATVGGGAQLTAVEQRRRMALLDASSRRPQGSMWRNELAGGGASPVVPHAASGSASHPGPPTCTSAPAADHGKFGNSIAAALHLRREEKEKTLLRRLQQQRRSEEEGRDGAALAEKDVEVGVFVTASYKALLHRNLQPAVVHGHGLGAGTAPTTTGDGGASGSDGDDDDDDGSPLAAYLRQLEGTRPGTAASVSTSAAPASTAATGGDYYERAMATPLLEERTALDTTAVSATVPDVSSGVAAAPASAAVPGAVASPPTPPTLMKLRGLLDGATGGASLLPRLPRLPGVESAARLSATRPATTTAAETAPAPEVEEDTHSAALAHARLLYDTRQARSGRTATFATLVASARLCDERIGASLFTTSVSPRA